MLRLWRIQTNILIQLKVGGQFNFHRLQWPAGDRRATNDDCIHLVNNIEELQKERRKTTGLSVRCLVAAVAETMSECQPLFFDEDAKAVECAVEWIQHQLCYG